MYERNITLAQLVNTHLQLASKKRNKTSGLLGVHLHLVIVELRPALHLVVILQMASRRGLRRVVTAAWAPEALPRRHKLAVVWLGRGGCVRD